MLNESTDENARGPIGGRRLPGFDVVEMEALGGEHIGTDEREMLGFRLTSKQDETSETGKRYGAVIQGRAVVWEEKTPARAMAALIYGVAMLARDGSLDPDHPGRSGDRPIQHVLNILSDRLAWHIAHRRDNFDVNSAAQARCNEMISALGTAISALARIKDL